MFSENMNIALMTPSTICGTLRGAGTPGWEHDTPAWRPQGPMRVTPFPDLALTRTSVPEGSHRVSLGTFRFLISNHSTVIFFK